MSRVGWKTQFNLISSASNFHNKVREIFATDDIFSHFKCYQEVPVNKLIEGYPDPYQKYDWYIDELNAVVELHGGQHYNVVNFGNIGYDQAQRNFIDIKKRDKQKKYAALDAGLTYIEIDYKKYNRLDNELLKSIIFVRDRDWETKFTTL